jgi:starch synthase
MAGGSLCSAEPRSSTRACSGQRPSIIHAHDWQTGLVPVYQKMHFSPDPIVGGVPAVFTIHNLAFQGTFPAAALPSLGFGRELMDIQALEYWGQISYLKGGVNFSEQLTTVSPTYAREILTPEFGFGFEGVLTRRSDALTGILNGIDVERWNPDLDGFIGASYSRTDLSGKKVAKRRLARNSGPACRPRRRSSTDRSDIPADLSEGVRPYQRRRRRADVSGRVRG